MIFPLSPTHLAPQDFEDVVVQALSGDPFAIRDLKHIRSKLQTTTALGEIGEDHVRLCTALLQGMDVLALPEVSKGKALLPDWHTQLRTASPLDSQSLSVLQELAWCERASRRLREWRRRAVAVTLDRLAGSGNLEAFADHVVRPLLGRRWLPPLTYEPPLKGAKPEEPAELPSALWDEQAVQEFSLPDRAVTAGLAGLHELLEQLETLPPDRCPHARDTVAYLRAALAVRSRVRNGQPVSAPVLFAPALPEWPLAHIMDVLILPQGDRVHAFTRWAAGVDGFVSQSFDDAHRAVAALCRDEPGALAEVSALDGVVLGDYPGGGLLTTPARGPSAGLALAAALLAYISGLAWHDGVLATAAISRDGTVIRLGDVAGLRQKGRAAVLHGYHAVVAAGSAEDAAPDSEHLRLGAISVGAELEIRPVSSLPEVFGPLLADPYDQLLSRLAASG